jgi:hypothetical protein
VGNGLVDAPDIPAFKEDVVVFRLDSVGIALQDDLRASSGSPWAASRRAD